VVFVQVLQQHKDDECCYFGIHWRKYVFDFDIVPYQSNPSAPPHVAMLRDSATQVEIRDALVWIPFCFGTTHVWLLLSLHTFHPFGYVYQFGYYHTLNPCFEQFPLPQVALGNSHTWHVEYCVTSPARNRLFVCIAQRKTNHTSLWFEMIMEKQGAIQWNRIKDDWCKSLRWLAWPRWTNPHFSHLWRMPREIP
jgi:hypothetical protein